MTHYLFFGLLYFYSKSHFSKCKVKRLDLYVHHNWNHWILCVSQGLA